MNLFVAILTIEKCSTDNIEYDICENDKTPTIPIIIWIYLVTFIVIVLICKCVDIFRTYK